MQVSDFGNIRNDYGTDPRYGTSYGDFGNIFSTIGRAIDPTRRGSATYATAVKYVGEENLQTAAAIGRDLRAQTASPQSSVYAPTADPIRPPSGGLNIGGFQISTMQIVLLAGAIGAFVYVRRRKGRR